MVHLLLLVEVLLLPLLLLLRLYLLLSLWRYTSSPESLVWAHWLCLHLMSQLLLESIGPSVSILSILIDDLLLVFLVENLGLQIVLLVSHIVSPLLLEHPPVLAYLFLDV